MNELLSFCPFLLFLLSLKSYCCLDIFSSKIEILLLVVEVFLTNGLTVVYFFVKPLSSFFDYSSTSASKDTYTNNDQYSVHEQRAVQVISSATKIYYCILVCHCHTPYCSYWTICCYFQSICYFMLRQKERMNFSFPHSMYLKIILYLSG